MTTRRSPLPPAPKLLSLAAAAGLVLAGAAIATPAVAAEQNVSDVTLTWGLNSEVGAGAYNGSCNFLSAGTAGNTGSSRVWTDTDGFHKASEGNVKIVKNGPSGDIPVTWANKCQTGSGTPVKPSGTTDVSGNKIVLSKGTGKVDPATGTGTVSWTGSFTAAFYGGLTYWSAKDPVLTVKSDGTATLKATASGYGADQNDNTVWNPIPAKTITLANLKGVTLGTDGFTVTPDYLGVVASPSGTPQSAPGSANHGAFPADFVDFQAATGGQSYWYSSGGGADARKVTTPLNVGWTLAGDPEPDPVGDSKNLEVGVEVPDTEVTPEPGKFSWSIAPGNAALGTATQNAGGGFKATGTLPTITVSDTRADSTGWTINGKASAFTAGANTFNGASLGWTPSASQPTGTITTGGTVAANDPGLGQVRTLASTKAAGGAVLDAGLTLLAPAGTPAGSYKSTLTITAISD